MSRQQQVELGAQARQVLDNPAFVAAVQNLEEKHTRTWLESGPYEADEREEAYLALRALRELTDELSILLDNGNVAARQIEREEKRNG